jgi:translation initiation factor 2 gamma subunit (eIF-2gamma)
MKKMTTKQAQLQKEWEVLMASHSKPLERGAKSMGVKSAYKPPKTEHVSIQRPKSNPKGMMGLATKSEPKVYTGDKIVGICTMHKSNLVPVFNHEAAIDVAKMRRG